MRRSVASAYSCSAGESEERSASLFARFASAGRARRAPARRGGAEQGAAAGHGVAAAGTPAARDSAGTGRRRARGDARARRSGAEVGAGATRAAAAEVMVRANIVGPGRGWRCVRRAPVGGPAARD